MTSIWKFSKSLHELDDIISFEMPRYAHVLSVANQNECLAIYAEVDPNKQPVTRRFRVAGTGHPLELPAGSGFVGTVLFRGGSLVFHVFDLGS